MVVNMGYITQANFIINNKIYELDRIFVDNQNYVKIADFKKVEGFEVYFNKDLHLPVINTTNIDSIKQPNQNTINVTAKELDLLQRITSAEARGEDEAGQILVVNVILNRVKSNKFPNSISDVIFQPNQFQPTRNGALDNAVADNLTKQSVQKALNGTDLSQGALFFRSVRGAEGSWHQRTLTQLFTHGNHIFYI